MRTAAWLDANPDAYVVNISRNYYTSDARLHRADAKQDLLPRPMFVSSSAVIARR